MTPKKYPKNFHTQTILIFLKTQKNIEIQKFDPQKNGPSMKMYENIRVPPLGINGSDCLCTDTWWQKNMHISCLITRDVFCTFLACARSAINVSCYGRFCRLLITFANSLDPDQAWQKVVSDLDPNCLTFILMVSLKDFLNKRLGLDPKLFDTLMASLKNCLKGVYFR